MVMAGVEGLSGPTIDDSTSRLQWLRQRKEFLQEKLALKNSELKTLCIEEAELTGILPAEIPLEPGETPPIIRKKSASNTNYSQNLLNKIKNANGNEETSLELERQVQLNRAEAALAVLNDPNKTKTIKRKHRSIYQQSQRRIQELDVQLNFIKQSHGGGLRHSQSSSHIPFHSSQTHINVPNVKPKVKKPRPPLDIPDQDLSLKLESRGYLHDHGGISLSPLSPEQNYKSYSSQDFQDLNTRYLQSITNTPPSYNRNLYLTEYTVDHRKVTPKFVEQDNNNTSITPDSSRNRSHSQSGITASNINTRNHNPLPDHRFHNRPVPNTYTEEERHYRRMRLKRQESEEILRNQQIFENKYLENEVQRKHSYHEVDFNASSPHLDSHARSFQNHKSKHSNTRHHRDSSNAAIPVIPSNVPEQKNKPALESYIPPGYWVRIGDEIVWCTDEELKNDRFGSLGRRKENVSSNSPSSESQSRYHTVSLGKNFVSQKHRTHLLPVHNTDRTSSNAKTLTRTQSLGSVETWSSNQDSSDYLDNSRNSSKSKEKDWIETSVDCNTSQKSVGSARNLRIANQRKDSSGTSYQKERLHAGREPVRSNSIPSNRHVTEHISENTTRSEILKNHYVDNRDHVLEIPAESNKFNDNGNTVSMIPLTSPTNHTVIQPGKYQPYREETKPFEMSDFYKYSTKFRKRTEISQALNEQKNLQTTPSNLGTLNNSQDDQSVQNHASYLLR